MQIIKIDIANFGKLKNFSIDFESGINLIYGENESGKSTLMHFILMAFYGFSSRSKQISVNIREKYRPWQGQNMAGTILFEAQGIRYILSRTFLETNRKDIVDLRIEHTGEVVDLGGQEPGQYFFNMGIEAFRRTLFIDSQQLLSGSNEEIESRLNNLVSTNDESLSYQKVQAAIDKEMTLLRSKRGDQGLLADLEKRIKREKLKLEEALVDEADKKEIEKQLLRYEEEIDIELKEAQKQKQMDLIDQAKKFHSDNEEKKNLEAKLKDYEVKKRDLYAQMDEANLNKQKLEKDKIALDKVIEKQRRDREKLDQALNQAVENKDSQSKFKPPLLLATLSFFALALTVYFLLTNKIVFSLFSGFVLLGLFAVSVRRNKNQNNSVSELSDEQIKLQEESDLLEKQYHTSLKRQEEIEKDLFNVSIQLRETDIALDYLDENHQEQAARLATFRGQKLIGSIDPRVFEASQERIKVLKKEIDQAKLNYLDKYGRFLSLDLNGQNSLTSLQTDYASKKAMAQERFKHSLYPDQVRANLLQLQQQHDQLLQERQILELVQENMQEASLHLSQEFGPLINEKTKSYLSKLTDGKYQDLRVTKDLDINVVASDRKLHQDAYLSAGTQVQAYLALRLALAEKMSGTQKNILFLDDIFVSFDANRTANAFSLLDEIKGNFGQIILFTSQKKDLALAQAAHTTSLS